MLARVAGQGSDVSVVMWQAKAQASLTEEARKETATVDAEVAVATEAAARMRPVPCPRACCRSAHPPSAMRTQA